MADTTTLMRQEWAEALRSGKYAQTKRVLRRKDGYCCLGVACDLFGGGSWLNDQQGIYWYRTKGRDCDVQLPAALQRALGLDNGTEVTLMDMNDRGESFDTIADYIETQLP